MTDFFIIGAGVTNMILDALFVALFNWGVKGAATATILSQMVGGILPLIYFFSKNDSLLRLGKTNFYPKALLKTCTNGASELMINISMSLVNILYNFQLIKFLGNSGVVAYGFVMYVSLSLPPYLSDTLWALHQLLDITLVLKTITNFIISTAKV